MAPHVSVVKPQSAFYERFGSRGIAVLERVIADSRAAGALVLLDVKRGDIGSTSQAYADAYLDPTSPLASDAITVSPFLGFGSLDPIIDTARRHDAGVFVLALTSNKEGPEVQHAHGRRAAAPSPGGMLDHLRRLNAGAEPLGSFGAVVGATIGRPSEDLAFNGPILAPGFGAQGGTTADVRRLFGARRRRRCPARRARCSGSGPDVDRDARRRTPDQRRAARVRRRLRSCSPWSVPLLARVRLGHQDGYCDAVEDHQEELSEIVGSGEPDAHAAGARHLRGPGRTRRRPTSPTSGSRSPAASRRCRRRWTTPASTPATYDRDKPPAGLTRRGEGRASTTPPRASAARETLQAFKDLDQQARDVCHTPLSPVSRPDGGPRLLRVRGSD